MKERPILFSAPMVRAILEGRKNQTRRVVKPQPPEFNHATRQHQRILVPRCPYGQPGDRLWVRESWAETDMADGTPVIAYRAGGCIAIGRKEQNAPDYLIHDYAFNDGLDVARWRPSIHMPRWASRIDLEIVAVRVERLNDINEADAIAEGWERRPEISSDPQVHKDAARDWYSDLWESINGPGAWDANPWVWVVEFRRIQQ